MNCKYSKVMGKKIGALRLAEGLVQEELLVRLRVIDCNLTRSILAKIEVGQRRLYPDEIRTLKTVLGVGYEELSV